MTLTETAAVEWCDQMPAKFDSGESNCDVGIVTGMCDSMRAGSISMSLKLFEN